MSDRKRLQCVLSMMKQRCNNPNNKDFKSYGAKGIKVCSDWDSSSVFCEWALNNGYKKGLEIERLDNLDGYNPNNCIFANRFIQNQNKRLSKNNRLRLAGIRLSYGKYMARIQVNKKSIYFGRFSDINEAIEIRNKYIIDNGLKNALNKRIENE